MKKILSLVLALALMFALCVPALADDVTITTRVDQTYTMLIPAANTALTWGVTTAQDFGTVGLSAARLIPGNTITVTISGADGLVNSEDSSAKIAYKVMNGNDEFTSAAFSNTTNNITLTIVVAQAAWDSAPAGDYSDTVTFTASVTTA